MAPRGSLQRFAGFLCRPARSVARRDVDCGTDLPTASAREVESVTPSVIVSYWLRESIEGPEQATAQRERWYQGGPEADAEIAARFTVRLKQALDGTLDGWGAGAEGALALVILLDQFTRTVYRGSDLAFAGDRKASEIAQAAIDSGIDRTLPVTGRIFLYHPYHHAESLDVQTRGIELINRIRGDAGPVWEAYLDRVVEGWNRHRSIVERFGRFPHRNAVLGRSSTAEELAYLDGGADRFGQ